MVDRFLVGPDGKREALYSCTFSEIRFKQEADGLELEITFSQKASEKRWLEMFYSRQTELSSSNLEPSLEGSSKPKEPDGEQDSH